MGSRVDRTRPKAGKGVFSLNLSVAAGISLLAIPTSASADIIPTYSVFLEDAVTGDNAFMHQGLRYWDVDPGSDRYGHDFYERPTVQTYVDRGGRFAANEYFEYLDITHAKVGFDDRYLYVAIDLFGRDKSTADGNDDEQGLVERYGFRFSSDPDGRDGYFFVTDQPELKNGTTFGTEALFGFQDTDGDVGGRGAINGHGPSGLFVSKSDNPWEEVGMNGYDEDIISDGRLNGADVLFSRVDPTEDTIVEMALDYTALGLTLQDILSIQYLDIEALKGDPADPANYLWNDKYTGPEAGSPNPGSGGFSEFGTQGLGNIYELDTLRGGAIPAPGTLALLVAAGMCGSRRRRR
jgi:hypothetical protein